MVTLPDERVAGFEALARWWHPERGVLPPAAFVAVAERSDLVTDLGRYVIRKACEQIRAWTLTADVAWARVAVNVSRRQFDVPGFAETVAGIVAETEVDPRRLELEITESALPATTTDTARLTVQHLRDLGVSVVLDGFGAGYSSLAPLSQLPLAGVKLHHSFTGGLSMTDSSGERIVEAVCAMARSLGLRWAGARVESVEQGNRLARLGCDRAQGFLFSPPLEAQHAREWVDGYARQLSDTPGSDVSGSAQAWMSVGAAAEALGVSASTVRRWTDDGRVRAQRTGGQHRRILVSDVMRLGSTLGVPRLNLGESGRGPCPGMAAVLADEGRAIVAAVGEMLYTGPTRGWFGSDAARRPVDDWLVTLTRACETGDYATAYEETAHLRRCAEAGGASLLECSLFVERFGNVLAHTMQAGGASQADLAAARPVLRAVRRSVLEDRSRGVS